MPAASKIYATLLLALAIGGSAGYAAAQMRQTHMQNALAELRSARHELDLATRNKGGHRSRAAFFVDQAIAQVEAGIAAREEERSHG